MCIRDSLGGDGVVEVAVERTRVADALLFGELVGVGDVRVAATRLFGRDVEGPPVAAAASPLDVVHHIGSDLAFRGACHRPRPVRVALADHARFDEYFLRAVDLDFLHGRQISDRRTRHACRCPILRLFPIIRASVLSSAAHHQEGDESHGEKDGAFVLHLARPSSVSTATPVVERTEFRNFVGPACCSPPLKVSLRCVGGADRSGRCLIETAGWVWSQATAEAKVASSRDVPSADLLKRVRLVPQQGCCTGEP